MKMQHIKDLLVAKGKTQTELAEMLGRNKSSITNLLQGKRQLKAQEVVKIAAFLGVTESQILGIEAPQKRLSGGEGAAKAAMVPEAAKMPVHEEVNNDTSNYSDSLATAVADNPEIMRIPFYGTPSDKLKHMQQVSKGEQFYYFEDVQEITDKSFALEVVDRALNLSGFLPGDILVCDMKVPFKAKDVVVVQVFENNATHTLLRIYQPPFLMPHSTDDSYTQLHEDRSNVRIIAPIMRLIRIFS